MSIRKLYSLLAVCALAGCGTNLKPANAPVEPPSPEPQPMAGPATAPSAVTPLEVGPSESTPDQIAAAPTTSPADSADIATTAPTTEPAEPTTAPSTLPATIPSTAPAATRPATAGLFLADLARISQGQSDTSSFASLPVPEQRILSAISQGVSDFSAQLQASPGRIPVEPLVDLGDRLRSVAPLKIPAIAICRKVNGYGAYETLDPVVPAMHEMGVIVYCEVAGFTSRAGDRAMWETRFNEEVFLEGADGQVIWRDADSTIVDACRNRRRDFYVARIVRLPGNIPAGRHTLKVRLTDQFSHESAETSASLEFADRPR